MLERSIRPHCPNELDRFRLQIRVVVCTGSSSECEDGAQLVKSRTPHAGPLSSIRPSASSTILTYAAACLRDPLHSRCPKRTRNESVALRV